MSLSGSIRRALIPLALFAGALTLSLVGMGGERYNTDEGRWIAQGQRSWQLLKAGRFDDPFWSESYLTFGRENPAAAKYLIGMSLELWGESAVGDGEEPDSGPLWAGRFSSALMGAIGILAFYGVARRVAGRSAAVLGCALLATSPVWLPATRRAMIDIHAAALGLCAVYLFLRAYPGLAERRDFIRPFLWLVSAGVVCGMAVGAKFNAVGVPLSLGLLLLWRLAASPWFERGDRRRVVALRILAGGIVFAACAFATFVALYPYLYGNVWARLHDVLEAWRSLRETHVEFGRGAFAGSYAPGWRSFREVALTVLLPGRVATALLLLPVVGAVATWVRPSYGLGDARRHLVIWCLAMPAGAAAVLESSAVVHHWFLWTSLVGALAVLLSRGGFRLAPAEEHTQLVVPAVVFVGTLGVVVATTTITWPRYYLQLIPWLCLLAGLGVTRLGEALRRVGYPAGMKVLVLSALVGCSAVLGAYPEPGTAKIARIAQTDWTSATRILSTLSAAVFLSLPVVLWLGRRRAGR